MHPLLQQIHDEIYSWTYESPAGLMQSAASLLRPVLDSAGPRNDLADFSTLYRLLDGFADQTLDHIFHTLHQWNAAAGSDELNDPESDDDMLSFQVGVVWVMSRSLMLFFNPEEKLETFAEWQEFTFGNIQKMLGMYLRS
ncbi:hypothetical protein CA51_48720 [Rosistilla oblonga]|uniref:hypothetical protein n=1 Tax=Rosistilla oblonga TaxID=2527990 RepID=UPI001188B5E0|nr:hypothetical protein [Rosistilla oblonga]QDV14962.1 hypothetical protein CA51_48720 [Rosistilla oblonga]